MALNYNNPMSDFNKKNTDMQAINKIAGGGMLRNAMSKNLGNRMPVDPNIPRNRYPNNKRLLPQPYDPSGQGMPDMSGMLRRPQRRRIPSSFEQSGRSLQDILTNMRQYKGMSQR